MSSARKGASKPKTAKAAKVTEPVGEQAQPQNPFPIVGIGASAGGLEAFTELLNHLPVDTGMAFLLVQHLDPEQHSHLTDLLAKTTKMPVREVKDGMAIKPDNVFVIPPNVNMGIANGKLKLTPRDEKHFPHLPVDFLFRSLAREQQSWAIGIILSGTGSDGSLGLAEIKGVGGLTFAQDEKSAKFSSMPQHAGNVDFVLPPEKIAQELARIGRSPYLGLLTRTEGEDKQAENAKDFRRILAILRSHVNVDFSQYRDTTIKRRIQRRMVVHTRHTFADYIKLLEKDGAEVKALFEDVLISVTSFFRDPEMFETLKAKVFPEILKTKPEVIRIWVTACSTGQEAYSMAIALLEFLENKTNPPAIQIFATDVNDSVAIEKSRRGLFPDNIQDEVSPERLRRYFTKEDTGYRISKGIRDLCIFAKQNIASDPPFSRMDLISCRNLLIYFTPDLQRHVISMFHYALNPAGFLVLGSSETVGSNSDLFAVLDAKHKIFSKKGMAVRPFSHFAAEDLKPGTLTLAAARGKPPYAATPVDFQREADRILLGRYAPAAALVNSNLEVLQFRGRTSPYLEQPSGPASFNLLKMARESLPLELGKMIQEVRNQNMPARSSAHLHDGEKIRKINLEIVPVKLTASTEKCYLVLFEEMGNEIVDTEKARQQRKEISDAKKPEAEKDRELKQLRNDLTAAREYLQAVVEQHDASNEELKCANEEVLSSNEELQSTNEQLATAKEELQSSNEELQTLNEELRVRNGELNQLNNNLNQAHEKLLDYVNATVDTMRAPVLVLRADLRIHKANDAFYETFKVPADETEGKMIYELGDGQWQIPKLRKLLSEILPEKSTLKDFEVTHNFPKIGRRVMLLNARRLEQKADVPSMIMLSIEDITEWKQIEEVNRWLAAIVESSGDAIIGKDLDGKIISCNQGATRLFGYAPEEIIGKSVTILIPPELQDEEVKILERIRRGERIEHYETVRLRKNGSRFDVSLTISPVKNKQGKIVGASKIARDITEHKTAEKNLAESLGREKAAREIAESASHAKDDFLAALSHELRTPLNPILLVSSDAAASKELPSGVRANFDMIRRNVELEARLIDDLLDLTRVSSGKLKLEKRNVNVHALLKTVISMLKAETDERSITVKQKMDAFQNVITGDTVRLQQVFWNVLKNAIKFTPPKGTITIETHSAHDEYIVSISDTGIGMTKQELERAFAAFMQGDHAEEGRRFGGLGLGLTISKKLVELHSGSIRAASAGRNRGSKFIIQFPLMDWNERPVKNVPLPSQPVKIPRLRILLVEDHEPTRTSLAALLIQRGHKIIMAVSASEALALTAKNDFDMVISDIGLPDGSGYDLLKKLRKQSPSLKAIALTGYGADGDIASSKKSGFDAHLTKPVRIQSLEEAIAKVI